MADNLALNRIDALRRRRNRSILLQQHFSLVQYRQSETLIRRAAAAKYVLHSERVLVRAAAKDMQKAIVNVGVIND